MNKFSRIRGLFLAILAVFAGNSVLISQTVVHHSFIKDTFDLHQCSLSQNDSIYFMSEEVLENNDGSYDKIVSYGLNRNKYRYHYSKTLQFLDSVRIEDYDSSSFMVTAVMKILQNSKGYILATYAGVYQYDKSNHIIWKVQYFMYWNIEEVCPSNDGGYVITGERIADGLGFDDTLVKMTALIDSNGLGKWEKIIDTWHSPNINGYSWYHDNLICHKNNIYCLVTDSIEKQARVNGKFINSGNLIKIDLSGNQIWSKHLNLSGGRFMKNSKEVFFGANDADTLWSWHIYKVDTNGGAELYMKYPLGGPQVYKDSLWITTQSYQDRVGNQNQCNFTITIFKVVDSLSISIIYQATYRKLLVDTIHNQYTNQQFEIDNDGNLLVNFETNIFYVISWNPYTFYWQPLENIMAKFVIRKDTTFIITDSLWNLKAVQVGTTHQISVTWNTLLNSDSWIKAYLKKDPTKVQTHYSALNVQTHSMSLVLPDTGWYLYHVKSVDTWGDTLSAVDSFYLSDPVGFNEYGERTFVSVNPKASNGNFNLETNTSGELILYNALGQMIFSESIEKGITKIDASHLSSGTYLYNFRSKENIITGKLIIQ